MALTDAQWENIAPLSPTPPARPDGRGRRWREPREILHGILWILKTGAASHDMPNRYPPHQTCHRRLQQWVRVGVLEAVLRALAVDLYERGGIDFTESFFDGSFASAKKGLCVGKTKRGKASAAFCITFAE